MNTPLLTGNAGDRNTDNSGPVTSGMVRKRAIELAKADDRSAVEVLKSAWEQAKQEMDKQDEDQLGGDNK